MALASSANSFPLPLKADPMNLEFMTDTDHRKRRRNRTTQSCLNCHTSKRKCDRKRPCQRCVQLGLTGLCVYEVDDPSQTNSSDETTRLRNRVAELESLVRELRGKPHPRWSDTSREGDPSDKWHSRATKCMPQKERLPSPEIVANERERHHHAREISSLVIPPIKTENPMPRLYQFSPRPTSPARYNSFTAENRQESSPGRPPFDNERHSFNGPQGHFGSHSPSLSFNEHPAAPSFLQHRNSQYSSCRSEEEEEIYHSHFAAHNGGNSPQTNYCGCRSSPGAAHLYNSLAQQVESTLNGLRQYMPHLPDSNCLMYRRIIDLNLTFHGNDLPAHPEGGSSYDNHSLSASTPSDEVVTPASLSTSSIRNEPQQHHSPYQVASPSSAVSVSPHDWHIQNMPNGYNNPYFPVSSPDSAYGHNAIPQAV